jgi:hypothetical protein
MCLTTYEEHSTATSHELERLRYENAVLHNDTLPTLDKDHELKVAYCRLSEVKHGWNYTHQHLDLAHEEVDIRTHDIIHLEHAFKMQGAELEETVETIANLE